MRNQKEVNRFFALGQKKTARRLFDLLDRLAAWPAAHDADVCCVVLTGKPLGPLASGADGLEEAAQSFLAFVVGKSDCKHGGLPGGLSSLFDLVILL